MMKYLLYLLSQDPRVKDVETFDRIALDTFFPGWVTLLLIALAIGLAFYAYRRQRGLTPGRRRFLTALRAAVYIALLFVLVQPSIKIDAEGKPLGPLAVVLDRTESMGIKDVAKKPRLEAAARLRRTLEAEARETPELQQAHYLYGPVVEAFLSPDARNASNTAGTVRADIKPAGDQTSLRDMIEGGLSEHRGVYCPGLLLITDSANNVPDDLDGAVDEAARRKIPVYFAAFGQERAKDVSLDHLLGEDIVFVNEKTKFFVGVTQNGYARKPIRIKASFADQPVPVADYVTEADGEGSFPVEFTPRTPGRYDLVVEAPPDSEESTAENNKVTRRIRVIKDRIRVLMVFGAPSWEYRFLCGAFDRDRRVDHKIYLQSADRRLFRYKQDRLIEDVPLTEADLFRKFDMVILSRVDMTTLPPAFLPLLNRFVSDEGGGLAVLADNSSIPFSFKGTKLEPILPVRITAVAGPSTFSQEMFRPLDTPFHLEVTEDGQGNPLTAFDVNRRANQNLWASFPALYECCTSVELKPSSIPLANAYVNPNGPRYPAIVYHSYGRGAVLYLGFDSTWRWRKEAGDRYFRDFWGKAIQFLGMPHLLGESAQARVFCDRLSATLGERVLVSAEIRNRDYSPYTAESVSVSMEAEGRDPRPLTLTAVSGRPGLYRATFYPDTEGILRFRLPAEFPGEPAELKVSRLGREFVNAGVKTALMSSIAAKTGGGVFYFDIPSATNKPAAAGLSDAADKRAERAKALAAAKARIEKRGGDPFADQGFLKDWSHHILKTISEQRLPVSILIERDFWDSIPLMILALLLLSTEYLFRKLWYLD